VDCAILSEVVDDRHVRALAMQLDGQAVEQYEYALPGTPCENATQKGYCEYHEGVVRLFPADKDLVDMRAEAYIGTPILDNGGKVIGILCALSRHRFVPPPMVKEVFKIIASRAGIEIKRKKAEEKIKEQVDYLERFQKISVKREFRIKELRDASEKLKAELEGLKHG
jgi:GAF domain-containing protein